MSGLILTEEIGCQLLSIDEVIWNHITCRNKMGNKVYDNPKLFRVQLKNNPIETVSDI